MTRVMSIVLACTAAAVGCQKSETNATPTPAPPSAGLVKAIADYCRVQDMPADKQKEGYKVWGWQTANDPEVGPVWTAAVRDKKPAAIATLRAAADQAVGAGNCNALHQALDDLEGRK